MGSTLVSKRFSQHYKEGVIATTGGLQAKATSFDFTMWVSGKQQEAFGGGIIGEIFILNLNRHGTLKKKE